MLVVYKYSVLKIMLLFSTVCSNGNHLGSANLGGVSSTKCVLVTVYPDSCVGCRGMVSRVSISPSFDFTIK